MTVTDPLGHVTITHRDAYERTVLTERMLGGRAIATTYGYDALDRLTAITDPLGASWAYAYDSAGRRISASDPDLGIWTYQYDDAGRLTQQTDARGNVSDLTYDALGRVLTKTVTPASGPPETTTSVYDEERPGFLNVGQLTRQTNAAARACMDYDALGRKVRDAVTIPASTDPCAP